MATNDSEEYYDSDYVEEFCEFTNFSTVSGAAYIAIFIISVTFNSLLLFVLFRYEKLKNITDLFVLNLACSDLVFTVTLVFFAVQELHQWVFGNYACKILTAMYFAGEYSSVMLLTAMTVDRFKTVVLQKCTNQARRQRCAKVVCAAAWVIGIAGSLVDGFKAEVQKMQCWNSSDEVLSSYLQVSLLFFLPLVIIIICYSAILKKVLHSSNKKKTRTVVVLLVIVSVFFVCWGPYNIVLLIQPQTCEGQKRHQIALLVCSVLAYAHCFMNPVLYMTSQKLRSHLRRLLPCGKLRGNNREKSTAVSVMHNATFSVSNSAMMQ